MRSVQLPCYGIKLRVMDQWGSITSTLREDPPPALVQLIEGAEDIENRLRYNAAIDGLEALILAHACAGVNILAPAYVEGVETAVEAIIQSMS